MCEKEKARINSLERYTPFITDYLGFECKALDKWSFLSMADEIFSREVYCFETTSDNPYVVDCGANIGLSTIYCKSIYPNAEIVAFEPYPLAIEAFKYNTRKLKGVLLIEKGVVGKDGEMPFFAEGSDGSRVAVEGDMVEYNVPVTILSPYLNKKVDLLKIDIEGSEIDVIRECRDSLREVQRMFIEYHASESASQVLDEILTIIKKAGFKYYIESEGLSSKHPFIKIEERLGYTMLLSIFCYR
jgi:FkbM family methyltransferase